MGLLRSTQGWLVALRVVRRLTVLAVVLLALSLSSVVSARTVDDGKPKVAITKGAQAWASRIVLKLGDFGPGWRAEKQDADDNSSKCFNRPPAPVRRTPGWINDHAIAACRRPSRASAFRDTNSSS
jgi:hypothetical protein